MNLKLGTKFILVFVASFVIILILALLAVLAGFGTLKSGSCGSTGCSGNLGTGLICLVIALAYVFNKLDPKSKKEELEDATKKA